MVGFDLGPLLQGQTTMAGNLLMSDLTFGPSFKVKRWFTGFGELSFRWIQICISSPMRRSSLFIWGFTSLSTLYREYHDLFFG